MSNLKEIKIRISSIESIMKITNAMEMVSASKLKKVKDYLSYCIEYNTIVSRLFNIISSITENRYDVYHNNNKILFIVISSNKGLCGSFNNLIFKKFYNTANKLFLNKEIFILTIGRLAKEFFNKKKYNIYADYSNIIEDIYNNKKRKEVIFIINTIIKKILQEEFNMIYILYNKFVNSSLQEVLLEKFFPISFTPLNYINTNYIIESSKKHVFIKILINYLNVKLLKFLLESSASEQISRMNAMHKATENASDIKNKLMISYNKVRQEIITNEILEVVNGAI